MQTWKGEDTKRFYMRDPACYEFTPLHICALKNRVNIAAKILEQMDAPKILLVQRDVRGWLPQHHAALFYRDLSPICAFWSGILEEKTANGMTCADLKKLAGLEVRDLTSKRVSFHYKDKHCKVSELSQEILREYTGLTKYVDHPVDPPHWKMLWEAKAQQPSHENPEQTFFLKQFLNWQANPPALKVCLHPELSGEMPLQLCSWRELSPGRVITHYAGEYRPLYHEQSYAQKCTSSIQRPYAYPPYDAATIGNASRWANCDVPNASVHAFQAPDGQTYYLMLATTFIAKDTPITYDYGLSTANIVFGNSIYHTQPLHPFFKPGLIKIFKEY